MSEFCVKLGKIHVYKRSYLKVSEKSVKSLINIHIFDYPDSRLSGLFTEVPLSPDNQGSTVTQVWDHSTS